MKKDSYEQQKRYTESEQKDMIFEFQSWMPDKITKSQQCFSDNNGFNLYNAKWRRKLVILLI